MSRDRRWPEDDALSESERARRLLERRLRAALTESEEDEAPLAEPPAPDPVPEPEPEHAPAPTPEPDPAADIRPRRVPGRPRPPLPLIDPVVDLSPALEPEPEAEPEPEPEPAEPPVDSDDAAPLHAPLEAPAADMPETQTPAPDLTIWQRLARIPVDPARLERNLVITANRHDPAHSAFDVLRTRMVQAMADHGWRRVGITSPTPGCGKSFTAINLAVSLSRLDDFRTVLLDLDLRRPGLAQVLGLKDMPATADFLRGEISAETYLSTFAPNMLNISDRLALGVNGRADDYASEIFSNPRTERILQDMQDRLAADLVLFDLPPALAMDDVLAMRPHLDCVLIVVSGSDTRARDLREVQHRLGEDLPVLGVVMNKAEIDQGQGYSYDY